MYEYIYVTCRGKRTTSIVIQEADVVDICVMNIKRMKLSHALLVALSTGEVNIYDCTY
jgi:hypothetical protein